MALSDTAFCINCGEEIEVDAEQCPECGASQDPHDLDFEEDSGDIIGDVDEESSKTFDIPKGVYHNKNWRRVKIAVVLPFISTIPFLLASAFQYPLSDSYITSHLSTRITFILSMVGGSLAYIGFIIYASRDKQVLHDECGQSTKRSPVMLTIFYIFTGGLYMFYYVFMRNHRYKIDEGGED